MRIEKGINNVDRMFSFIHEIVDAQGVVMTLHHRLVMLDPVANQSRTVLCTKPGKHNVDALF